MSTKRAKWCLKSNVHFKWRCVGITAFMRRRSFVPLCEQAIIITKIKIIIIIIIVTIIIIIIMLMRIIFQVIDYSLGGSACRAPLLRANCVLAPGGKQLSMLSV